MAQHPFHSAKKMKNYCLLLAAFAFVAAFVAAGPAKIFEMPVPDEPFTEAISVKHWIDTRLRTDVKSARSRFLWRQVFTEPKQCGFFGNMIHIAATVRTIDGLRPTFDLGSMIIAAAYSDFLYPFALSCLEILTGNGTINGAVEYLLQKVEHENHV